MESGIGYRFHVYSAAMAVSAKATTLALSLSKCVAERSAEDYKERERGYLPDLILEADALIHSVEKLFAILPPEAEEEAKRTTKLLRHINWIHKRLNERLPLAVVGDPIDIVQIDLPAVLEIFDKWYCRQSPVDAEIRERLTPLTTAGHSKAAARELWIIFKSRMVKSFDLPNNLDGHKLVDTLFSKSGRTVDIFTDEQRQGYLNLFKGLYTLFRNPVMHGDASVNTEEVESVIALVNSFLVRVEQHLIDIDGESVNP